MLALVGADFAFERFDRTGLGAERLVIPALEGGEPQREPSAPPMGWRHFLAARAWSCACSWPRAGGAAKSGPITLKRKCAQRSWDREVDDVFFIGCRDFYFFHHFGGAAGFTPALPSVSPGILCGSGSEPHITNCFPGSRPWSSGPGIGANPASRSRRSTPKLTHNDQGSVLWTSGGMNRARASFQNGFPRRSPATTAAIAPTSAGRSPALRAGAAPVRASARAASPTSAPRPDRHKPSAPESAPTAACVVCDSPPGRSRS